MSMVVLLWKVHYWICLFIYSGSLVQYILAYTIFFTATFSYVLGAVYIWFPGIQTRAEFYCQNEDF